VSVFYLIFFVSVDAVGEITGHATARGAVVVAAVASMKSAAITATSLDT